MKDEIPKYFYTRLFKYGQFRHKIDHGYTEHHVEESQIFTESFIPNKTCYGLQVGLRELEGDLLSSKFLVDASEGAGLMLNVGLLGLVQVDLQIRKLLESRNRSTECC